MGIATPSPPIFSHHSSTSKSPVLAQAAPGYSAVKSMSQDYNPSIFNFLGNGFERSSDQDHQQHVVQQIRRDKLRLQGFEPMAGIEEEHANLPVYETTGMLSEMFNFPPGGGGSAAGTGELLDHSMAAAPSGFRAARPPPTPPPPPPGIGGDWYSKSESSHHSISSMNADSAVAMQLFLMKPQTRSPSPPHQPPAPASSTLHMLLPSSNPSSSLHDFSVAAGGFTGGAAMMATPPPPLQQQSTFGGSSSNAEIGSFVEGQGLSLSLSSSLQHLEAAKAEELRSIGSDGLLFYNQGASNSPALSSTQYPYKHSLSHSQNRPVHIGYGSSLGVVNVLKNSKYLKAAQELLEEFCSVGRGHFKKTKLGRSTNPNSSNPSSSSNNNNNGGDASSSSTSKETPPLSAADRMEHQRRKVKLLSMLDEVDRRYSHYCEQMQMVVNSFDLVMGFGSAVPYTALAQKAMSRHFRCLKDAIAAQLKLSYELLGEKDGAGTSGITKGETPKLKIIDQSFRQPRAFHQMGMMEQEAWRPQRGLPERSVNILRAWLFEHFLHPYPSDADKHLLARQTGLSRNQGSAMEAHGGGDVPARSQRSGR
ncbi:BEL1-like homeodomain protein 2 isoform X2 [Punica granatum]|uniref:BEL1-like homeodomain protein 2 isoform X2 n=1 Tax=Punica granatum TaxID=22663 RepID=A0A6P8E4E5_PUNGR|nr:BEL1-like homeodomain protein 2 isoform X2 [Punica granatum]